MVEEEEERLPVRVPRPNVLALPVAPPTPRHSPKEEAKSNRKQREGSGRGQRRKGREREEAEGSRPQRLRWLQTNPPPIM